MSGCVLPERCTLVIDQALPAGRMANCAAVLGVNIGARYPELVGPDYTDGDGATRLGLMPLGLAVLAAPATALPALRRTALDADLLVIDFPVPGQATTDYTAFISQVAATADLTYLGVAVCGPTTPARKITNGLSLMR